MKKLGLISLVIVLVIALVGGLSFTSCRYEHPLQTIVEEGWLILSEGLTAAGEILLSVDTALAETTEALASAYLGAGDTLESYSGLLLDQEAELEAEEPTLTIDSMAMTVASMATQFRETGYALADGDFTSVANALSNLANQFEVLADPTLETDTPAILEALQNTIHLLTEQAEIARRISDPSPWLAQYVEVLDFYDAHTIEELQELAFSLLEEVQEPEERARFGLDDPELVEALENLSETLTSAEFQEWVDIARSDLSGWFNQAIQETFILKTVELGHALYTTGYGMSLSLPAQIGLITGCKDECLLGDARNCQREVKHTPFDWLDPHKQEVSLFPLKLGQSIAAESLKSLIMNYIRVYVWMEITWEWCQPASCAKHLWFTTHLTWVKQWEGWRLILPPLGKENPDYPQAWFGRKLWDDQYKAEVEKAIKENFDRACPVPH